MTEIEKELERFIASGKATTKVNSGRFQTTHIDPLKIAKHFAQWQREQMMKDAISGLIFGSRYFRQKNISLTNLSEEQYDKLQDFGERVKVIIIKD